MRKIVYLVNSSIDGFVDAADGVFDWAEVGEEYSAYSTALTERCGTLLYGRKVWDMMSGFWPRAESLSDHPHDLRYAPIWRATPKIVFSRTLRHADWNTTVIGGDLAREVAALKDRPGEDLLLMGGGELASALTEHRLIDEYHIAVHRIALGAGKKLLPHHRVELDLVASRVLDGRILLGRYTLRPPA
ncbi:dihydrofolate reductase family protein [Actinocorallia aurea]